MTHSYSMTWPWGSVHNGWRVGGREVRRPVYEFKPERKMA